MDDKKVERPVTLNTEATAVERCGNCRYWNWHHEHMIYEACRRRAPTLVLGPAPDAVAEREIAADDDSYPDEDKLADPQFLFYADIAVWPKTRFTDGCGDWVYLTDEQLGKNERH